MASKRFQSRSLKLPLGVAGNSPGRFHALHQIEMSSNQDYNKRTKCNETCYGPHRIESLGLEKFGKFLFKNLRVLIFSLLSLRDKLLIVIVSGMVVLTQLSWLCLGTSFSACLKRLEILHDREIQVWLASSLHSRQVHLLQLGPIPLQDSMEFLVDQKCP